MEAVGIVAAVAAIFTTMGAVFAVHGFRGLRETKRFVTGERRTVEFESAVGSNLAPRVGQVVTVLYDPLDPEEARIRSFMMLWEIPSDFAILGALLLVPGILMLSILLLLFAL